MICATVALPTLAATCSPDCPVISHFYVERIKQYYAELGADSKVQCSPPMLSMSLMSFIFHDSPIYSTCPWNNRQNRGPDGRAGLENKNITDLIDI